MNRTFLRIIVQTAAILLIGLEVLHAQSVQFTIADTTGRKGDTLLVPIQASAMTTNDSVYSGQFTLTFDSGVIEVLGIEKTGSLSASISSVLYNTTTRAFAFAGTSIVTGSGPFVYLQVRIKDAPTKDTTTIAFANAVLNEGVPSLTLDGGKVRILKITISPKTPSPALIAGDSLQFSLSGDVLAPVTWTSSDPGVGTISPTGKLVTVASGQLKIHVQDSQGLKDSTNLFPVYPSQARDLTLSLHDTSYTQTLEFNLPVYVSDVSSLGILSAQLSITYSNSIIQAISVVQANSMTSSWSEPAYNITSGKIDLVLAGTQPLSGSGILVYVRFRVQPTASGFTTMNITGTLFNENLTAEVVSGKMTAITAPTVVITPNTAVMTRGDSLLFQVTSGGTPPYVWTSTSPSIASINASTGYLAAHLRGTTTVKVVDSFGFTRTTGLIIVNDVTASLPDTGMGLADSIEVPLTVEDLTGYGVISFDARIVYDSTIVRPTAFVTTGTLSSGFTVFLKDTLDTLRVVAAGTSPLMSAGTLIKLRFKTIATSTGVTSPLILAKLVFNESDPSSATATTVNGSLAIIAVPSVPALNAPANGATNVSRNAPLSWGQSAGATSYKVQVSTNPSFSTLVVDTSTSDSSIVTPQLAANTLHYWRVSAKKFAVSSAFSPPRSFTTVPLAAPPPPVPVLTSPANGATNVARNAPLAWGSSSGATSYRVQVSLSNTFSTTVVDTTIAGTAHTTKQLAANTLHFWRVGAQNSGGSSAFSASRSFTTAPVSSVGELEGIPTVFGMDQNYPNPFNPTTQIRFSIPQRSYVTIRVYSLLGDEIETILSQERNAGWFEVSFDASRFSSGVYFYVMKALPLDGGKTSPFEVTRKMILMK